MSKDFEQLSADGDDSSCHVPEEFVCPISLQVMKDPVMSRTGQNYERKAILEWLTRGHVSCPLTRQPLKPSALIPNHSLKKAIIEWKQKGGFCHHHQEDDIYSGDCTGTLDDEKSFIGLITIEKALIETILPNSSSVVSRERRTDDDDLQDLLALFNEVLELTSDGLHAPVVPQNVSSSSVTATETRATNRNGRVIPNFV